VVTGEPEWRSSRHEPSSNALQVVPEFLMSPVDGQMVVLRVIETTRRCGVFGHKNNE
jgi:hypothetical protein